MIRVLQMVNKRIVMYDGTEGIEAAIKIKYEMDVGVEGVDWEFSEDGKYAVIINRFTRRGQ